LNSRFLHLFDHDVRIDFDDPSIDPLIVSCYSAFLVQQHPQNVSLTIDVLKCSPEPGWTVDDTDTSVYCDNVADLVYFIEKYLTVGLQKIRTGLYFVHAAAVSSNNACTLLVGESGVGKSTLCWNLCNEGFTYMSDELAPVDPATLEVEPYPHALCLKSASNAAYRLPAATLDTAVTLHVPVEALPLPVASKPTRIRNIIFLTHGDGGASPAAEDISRSEAAARLYANSLNQLAHEHDGLAAAARVVSAANCFHMERGTATRMLQAVRELIGSPGPQR
jgi:hypothetical protein